MMSTGLACDQVRGRAAFSFSIVAVESSASSPLQSMSWSTASTPAPPPLVTIPTRARSSGTNRAVISTASNSSAKPVDAKNAGALQRRFDHAVCA